MTHKNISEMFIWTTLLDVIEYKTVAIDVTILPFIYESVIALYANVTVKVLKVLSELFINYESKNLINLTFFRKYANFKIRSNTKSKLKHTETKIFSKTFQRQRIDRAVQYDSEFDIHLLRYVRI